MKGFSRLLILGLGVLVIAVGVALFRPSAPQSSGELVLPDGTTVRIVTVTYGTNHEFGSLLARLVRQLPQRGQQLATALLGNQNLAWAGYQGWEPSTVVWLERVTNSIAPPNSPSRIVAWLGDESGFTSGNANILFSRGQPFSFMTFHAVPKRSKEVSLHFFGSYPNGSTNLGSLRFNNLLHGDFPQWEAETLPSTKRVGDVEVTLASFTTGLGSWHGTRNIPDGGRELLLDTKRQEGRNFSVFVAYARSLVETNQTWRVKDVVLSDATGNRLEARMKSDPYENDGWDYFEHALWTNEHAWKVDLEVIRVGGFAPEELLTFRNVPLGDFDNVNELGWASNLHGGGVTLKSFLRKRPDGTNLYATVGRSAAELTLNLPTNTHLSLVGAWLNSGETNMIYLGRAGYSSRSQKHRTEYLPNVPVDRTTVDITYSVQTSRWVRFTVEPEVGRTRMKVPKLDR